MAKGRVNVGGGGSYIQLMKKANKGTALDGMATELISYPYDVNLSTIASTYKIEPHPILKSHFIVLYKNGIKIFKKVGGTFEIVATIDRALFSTYSNAFYELGWYCISKYFLFCTNLSSITVIDLRTHQVVYRYNASNALVFAIKDGSKVFIRRGGATCYVHDGNLTNATDFFDDAKAIATYPMDGNAVSTGNPFTIYESEKYFYIRGYSDSYKIDKATLNRLNIGSMGKNSDRPRSVNTITKLGYYSFKDANSNIAINKVDEVTGTDVAVVAYPTDTSINTYKPYSMGLGLENSDSTIFIPSAYGNYVRYLGYIVRDGKMNQENPLPILQNVYQCSHIPDKDSPTHISSSDYNMISLTYS